MVPSGKVMRTDGTFTTVLGTSASAARKSNNCGHFRGFLALATFPSEPSTSAYARSPNSPRFVMSAAFNSSPIMDLTEYRQRETIEPRTLCVDPIIEASARCQLASAPFVQPGYSSGIGSKRSKKRSPPRASSASKSRQNRRPTPIAKSALGNSLARQSSQPVGHPPEQAGPNHNGLPVH